MGTGHNRAQQRDWEAGEEWLQSPEKEKNVPSMKQEHQCRAGRVRGLETRMWLGTLGRTDTRGSWRSHGGADMDID